MTLTVGGLTFTSDPVSGWGLSELEGWFAGAPLKTETRERSQADGGFGVAKFYRSSRVVTVTGYLTADATVTATAMRYAVAAMQSDGLPGSFVVDEDGFVLTMSVTMVGTPEIVLITDTVYSYTLQFVASDPLKYGPELVVSTGLGTSGTGLAFPIEFPINFGTPGDPGRVITVNVGTAATYSVFDIQGGLSGGFELKAIETGEIVRFERAIPVVSTIRLNPRTGRASIDGQSDVSRYLTRREWWSIPAGTTRTVQFTAIGSTSGTPTLTAYTKPAYW